MLTDDKERLKHRHDKSQRRGLHLSPEECAALFDTIAKLTADLAKAMRVVEAARELGLADTHDESFWKMLVKLRDVLEAFDADKR